MSEKKQYKLSCLTNDGKKITEVPLSKGDDGFIICIDDDKIVTTRELSHKEIVLTLRHLVLSLVGGAVGYDRDSENHDEHESFAALSLCVAYEVFHNLWLDMNPEYLAFDEVQSAIKGNMDDMLRDLAKQHEPESEEEMINRLLETLQSLREEIENL